MSCEFDKGVSDPGGGKAPYLAIAYLNFNSADELQNALAKHGAEITGDIPNYTKIEPIMQVNEAGRRTTIGWARQSLGLNSGRPAFLIVRDAIPVRLSP